MKNLNSKVKLILSIIVAIVLMFFLLKMEAPELSYGIVLMFIIGCGIVYLIIRFLKLKLFRNQEARKFLGDDFFISRDEDGFVIEDEFTEMIREEDNHKDDELLRELDELDDE